MKQYKVWQAPLWAFFSTNFYRDLASHGKGVGFVYLLCVLAVSCGIESIQTGIYFYKQAETIGPYYAEQVPIMEIKNGKMTMDKESIYYVFDRQSQRPVVAFDTSNARAGRRLDELGVMALVTDTGIILNMGNKDSKGFEQEVLNFAIAGQMKMDKNSFMQTLKMSALAVPLIDFALRLAPAWAVQIFQAFGFSVAGLILAQMISIGIKYEGILRVSSFAVGNAVIIGILAKLFPSEIAGVSLTNFGMHLGLIQLLVAFAYTLFGVSANLSEATFQAAELENESRS